MEQKTSARWLYYFIVTAILALTFSLGVYVGYSRQPAEAKIVDVSNKNNGEPNNVDFTPFWQAWGIINEKYVFDNGNSSTTKQATNQDKVWGAISGLTASLGDPYSVFLPPVKKKIFEDDIRGNFGGVGIEVGVKNGVLMVIAPLPDSPAKRAGVEAGDKILKIDDKNSSSMSTDEAVSKIRGEQGTVVKLTLSRGQDNKIINVSITREVIKIPVIKIDKLKNGVFVIRLYSFSADSPNAFRDALRQFVESKSNKLVLDLRGNPGGYLDAAVDMASWFLPVGQPVVVEKHGGSQEDKVYRSIGYDIFNNNLKMVILIDKGSASASEILAGALSEYGKATLVGETSFGKGSVQELVPVTSDSSIKITIAKWYTPKGHSISLSGLKPNVEVPFTEDDLKAGRDPQQDKAVQILLGK